MIIRARPGERRRFAWANRENGRLILTLAGDAPKAGLFGDSGFYVDGSRVIEDFFAATASGGDLHVPNAEFVDYGPDGARLGFQAVTADSPAIALSIAAIHRERALWLSLEGGDAGAGIGLSFIQSIAPMRWSRLDGSGPTVYRDERGVAIASSVPFTLEESGPFAVICRPRPKAVNEATGANPTEAAPFSVYCAFSGSSAPGRPRPPLEAATRARDLSSTDAIRSHRRGIGDFIARRAARMGDPVLDAAGELALVNAWTFLPPSSESDAFSGLSFRDLAILLMGFLLPQGCIDRSRLALASLAARLASGPGNPEAGSFIDGDRRAGADATPLFAIACWAFLDATGDRATFDSMSDAVFLSLDAALSLRVDDNGFLLHGAHDTRMAGGMTARGDRAVEVEALWCHALALGSRIARLRDDGERARRYAAASSLARESFGRFFWDARDRVLADRLPPGDRGAELPDFSARPNQLVSVAVPNLLDGLGEGVSRAILDSVARELATPIGVASLSPDDPLFHPRLAEDNLYGPESSRDNGPVDFAMTLLFADCLGAEGIHRPLRDALLRNGAIALLGSPFAGFLPRTIGVPLDKDGAPDFDLAVPDLVYTAAFASVGARSYIGFTPRLSDGTASLAPRLPAGVSRAEAKIPFGDDWSLEVRVARLESLSAASASASSVSGEGYRCEVLWLVGPECFSAGKDEPSLSLNDVPLSPGVPVTIETGTPSSACDADSRADAGRPAGGSGPAIGTGAAIELRDIFALLDRHPFPERDLAPPWCGSVRVPRFLEYLRDETALDSLMGEDRFTASLAWYFDSDRFYRASVGRLPLGAFREPARTAFRLWAPTAREVSVILFPSGAPDLAGPKAVVPMRRLPDGPETGGIWEAIVPGDLHGEYYAYSVRVHGVTRVTADPRARACGVNGVRSMVADFARTDPELWADAKSPFVESPNDVVAYELHVADLTASPSWDGPETLGRSYLGAAREGTSRTGAPTGFDHVRSLGVTHVQLLPVADFSSVDETRTRDGPYRARLTDGLFNWGYDPFNASVPEGSYSTDPEEGTARVREFKSLVAAFARAGIGVIMDVVYNHVPAARRHPLGLSVPGYFFRIWRYSGAGDDTASERPMCRAWIVDSLAWWLSEYRLSGFRFDLMGLHDVGTMRAVEERLRGIRSDVILYGEGWDMFRGKGRGRAMVAASMLAPRKLDAFGFFNDAFRCGVKGSAFSPGAPGFVHDGSRRESVKFGLVGAVYHPQVRNSGVTGTANPNPWTDRTASSIPYVEIHDNMTLHDKLVAVEPGRDDGQYARLQRLSIALVLLAQGMPVLHAGMEFMRTKEIPRDLLASDGPDRAGYPPDVFLVPSGNATGSFRAFSRNSYNLCDRVNALDWDRRARWGALVDYARDLIALRRGHPVFRLRTQEAVASLLSFVGEGGEADAGADGAYPAGTGSTAPASGVRYPETVLAWTVRAEGTGDEWKAALMVCNVSALPASLLLPPSLSGSPWRLVSDGERVFPDREREPIACPAVTIAAKALYVYADF